MIKKTINNLRTDSGGCGSTAASVTVETAVAFPLFFFFIWMVWQCFLLLLLQLNITLSVARTVAALSQTGVICRAAYGDKCENAAALWVPTIYADLLTETAGFTRGLIVRFEEDGESVYNIEVRAEIRIAAPFYKGVSIPVKQVYKVRANTGVWDKNRFASENNAVKEENKERYYVTESGTVYHRSLECSHLSVKAEAVPISDIAVHRNRDGKRYTACPFCKRAARGNEVYITAYGTKYHYSADCLALKRTVREVGKDEIEGLKPCSRCGGKNE